MNPLDFLISPAYAQAAAAPGGAPGLGTMLLPIVVIGAMLFLSLIHI